MAQTDNPQPCTKEPCFKCGKPGHFTRECCSYTQINQTYFIGEQDDMIGLQMPMSLSNLLDNVLMAFNSLPNNQKDELIQKYEGGSQNFPNV